MKSESVLSATALFPLGCPRSGTTFVARILNAHPEILMTYETAVFLQLNHRILNARATARPDERGKRDDLWGEELARNCQPLIEKYYEKIARLESKKTLAYWGDKHPHHAQQGCLDFIDGLYPEARYIYIVRDPRDSACSIAAMRACDFEEAITIWQRLSKSYEQFVGAHEERVQIVRYEDLVERTEGETRSLLEGLDLAWHADVHTFLTDHARRDVHAIGLSRYRPRDFSAEAVGRWRREISPQEDQLARRIVGDFIERYGYSEGIASC